MKKKLIAMLIAATLTIGVAAPALAATITYYMNGYTCYNGQDVGIRITNMSNATLDKIEFRWGMADNSWSLIQSTIWKLTSYPALPNGQSRNYYTGHAKVFSQQTTPPSAPSWTKATISEWWSPHVDAYYFCY